MPRYWVLSDWKTRGLVGETLLSRGAFPLLHTRTLDFPGKTASFRPQRAAMYLNWRGISLGAQKRECTPCLAPSGTDSQYCVLCTREEADGRTNPDAAKAHALWPHPP